LSLLGNLPIEPIARFREDGVGFLADRHCEASELKLGSVGNASGIQDRLLLSVKRILMFGPNSAGRQGW
jgi:hypothetical protein